MSCLGSLLLVRLSLIVTSDEELQKQEKITSIHHKSCSIVFFLNHTSLIGRIIVESSQSNCDTNYHLGNLKCSDDHRIQPLWAHSDCHQKIIKVHACMYRVVHHHKEDARWGSCNIRMPAIEQDRDMMIPMKKN